MRNSSSTMRMSPRQAIGIGLVLMLLVLLGMLIARRLSLSNEAPSNDSVQPTIIVPTVTTGVQVIPTSEQIVQAGVTIQYEARPADQATDLTDVRFSLADAATGQPVTPMNPPAVWIQSEAATNTNANQQSCDERIRQYVRGTLDLRAEIDLNSYFVLTLNQDASISVIDPLNGVQGISQLYTMILLPSPGEDWVASRDGRLLFVSMPQAGQVAVIDTDTFRVTRSIDVGLNPVQLALQPDGRYVWVGNNSTDITDGGVTVIDVNQLAVVAQIPTGRGAHAIAFSGSETDLHAHENSTTTPTTTSYAFIANSTAGTVSVIDTDRLQKQADIAVEIPPTSLTFASASNTLFVSSSSKPGIFAFDVTSQQLKSRQETAAAAATMRVAPGGRWVFALDTASNQVLILDAITYQIVHSVAVAGAPDQISFSAAFAYVAASERPEVALFDLTQLDKPGQPAPVTIIGGQAAPSTALVPHAAADLITPIHEHGSHVLIANPADQSIYEYMEGMNAPMGSFQTYNRTPRAVHVVDRAIRMVAPGSYASAVKITKHGTYQVAFLLDSPRVIHCFSFQTEPAPAEEALTGGIPQIMVLNTERETKLGMALPLRIALTDPATGSPLSGIDDLTITAVLVSGQHTTRFHAEADEIGTYSAALRLPSVGDYLLYFSIPSRQATIRDLPSFMVRVTQ